MNVLKAWENIFGSETDFLHKDLQKENALGNMNQFAALLDGSFPGQPADIMGYILIELCRFSVTWLPRLVGDT